MLKTAVNRQNMVRLPKPLHIEPFDAIRNVFEPAANGIASLSLFHAGSVRDE